MTQLILSAKNRDILGQLAWSNLLCAFDFDGTLAPIVEDPDSAAPLDGVPATLERLAARFGEVAVVSGRPLAFLERWFPEPSGVTLVGLYGLEARRMGERADHPTSGVWRETMADLGDSRLALPKTLPLAIRAQAYVQARDGEDFDPATGPTGNDASFDFQTPYLIKLLSSAPLSDHITFYFYGIFAEKGGNGEALIAHPHSKQGSAIMSSLVGCNALVELPADATEILPNTKVPAILLDAV